MIDEKAVIGAITAIFVALVSAWVLGQIPDPQREVINALPDTNPDIKAPANTMLDVKDHVETAKDSLKLVKNIDNLLLAFGIPIAVIGGLIAKFRSG